MVNKKEIDWVTILMGILLILLVIWFIMMLVK